MKIFAIYLRVEECGFQTVALHPHLPPLSQV